MVDVQPYESMDSPVKSANIIINEVNKWSPDLASKPRWLVLNKIDRLADEVSQQHCQDIVEELQWKGPVFEISALKKQGVQTLMYAIMDFMDQQRLENSEQT